MDNRVMNFLSVLCFIVAIGALSWRDMHPREDVIAPAPYAYHISSGIKPDQLPDEGTPLIIPQGSFSYTGGKMRWVPGDIAPVLIPQRQLYLSFTFSEIPRQPEETIRKITEVQTQWQHLGTMSDFIVIEYKTSKPDLKNYAQFLDKISNSFKHRTGFLATLDPDWIRKASKETLESLHLSTVLYILPLSTKETPQSILPILKDSKDTLVLLLPPGAGFESFKIPSAPPALMGIAVTLDPKNLPQKAAEKIGLFPKL